MKIRQLCLGGLLALTVTASHAAITYVDASEANTSTTGAPPFPTAGNVYNDDQWSLRTVGTNNVNVINNNVFEAGPNGVENAPMLTTTITGLTAGEPYDIFVYFVTFAPTDQTQLWQIEAGLTSDSLTFFNRNTTMGTGVGQIQQVPAGSTTYFDNGVTVPSNRQYIQGSLGTAIADGSGQIQVFVDAPDGTNEANHRTWYDGVGYELIPEPSTALLSLVGMTFLLRRRR